MQIMERSDFFIMAYKIICVLLALLLFSFSANATGYNIISDAVLISNGDAGDADGEVESAEFDCKSAILMEANTGKIIYSQNADEALTPASVTKVMTLLLVMEAIDEGRIKLDDMVVTSERASSMGGSQIFLEVGERMTVEDMLKSVIIASANDAACALAEFCEGSEESFVGKMNARAKELGMENTHFENTNGLDDSVENHKTSAKDIAIMSRELIRHEKILEYSSIWMDTIRGGAFGLTNTNRLVKFYNGCTGLKTGSTDKAGFCISATAKRGETSLICVVMGASTRDERNKIATTLLDRGFAKYEVYVSRGEKITDVPILGAFEKYIRAEYEDFEYLAPKGYAEKISKKIILEDDLSAPLAKGEVIGRVSYFIGEREIGSVNILSVENVDKIGYFELLLRAISRYFLK